LKCCYFDLKGTTLHDIFGETFLQEEINGEMLLMLEENEIKKLGNHFKVNERYKILKEIKKIKDNENGLKKIKN
jgi:hypothetical protein